ncbi:2313_t:CDS:2 [Funneliformis mosseae]|uniref:2313_t:CDS:1 n=1 Tax=Funneliformis mosseae TaxID=27381 RepID=A0A9N9ANZ3_FUNMO|nr:2313_t:CDS:2 [Funneliformis mosseae]
MTSEINLLRAELRNRIEKLEKARIDTAIENTKYSAKNIRRDAENAELKIRVAKLEEDFSNNTSASNSNTSEDILLNNTLEESPLTSEIPPIPPCFEGLEEQWADLNKNGRDFRKEIWFRTHIDLSRKEKIIPLEHLANFFRRALQEESLDDSHENLQEEDLDNGDFNYQESELCTLTDETSSDEDLVDD